MKTLAFDINPVAGDLLLLQYRSSRGGRTHVAHLVKGERKLPVRGEDDEVIRLDILPPETGKDVALALADQINKTWVREAFTAKVNDKGTLIVHCNDAVSDVTFSHDIEGKGGSTVTMTEF